MIINYQRILKKPIIFKKLIGMNIDDFNIILEKLRPIWKKKFLDTYKRPGRNFKIEFSDMLIMWMIYYQNFVSQRFLGYLFGIDNSRVCRLIMKIDEITLDIPIRDIHKDPHLSQEEIENIIKEAPYS